MGKHVFVKFCQNLWEKQWLEDSRKINGEKMAVFLITIGYNEIVECYKKGSQHSSKILRDSLTTPWMLLLYIRSGI